MRFHRALVLVAAALLVGLPGGAPASMATFVDVDATAGDFSTTQLYAPADLAVTGGASAVLTWTPSSSDWATGYEVLRSAVSGSDYTSVGTVTPVSATTTTDAPGTGTWYYVLRTTFHNWTSVVSNEASVVVQSAELTTPVAYCDPALNAPEAANAGDNDGYESNPGRACVPDGQVAVDRDSGTSTSNSCLTNAKDRHQFWGYAFDLPATVNSITGVTISALAGQSNNGGTTWLCVELSTDGGATWTVPRRVDMAGNALSTYTFGGPLQLWERTWTREDFDGDFRVRITDSSTQPTKDFRLDGLGVLVSYVP